MPPKRKSNLTLTERRSKIRKIQRFESEIKKSVKGNKIQQKKIKNNDWLCMKNEAFHYNPTSDYINFPQIYIGKMDVECKFCKAIKFKGEESGLCCLNGKVKLPDYNKLPDPLKRLINGTHPQSKEFFSLIRTYNSSFQMTSFGTSAPLQQQQFISTFKIQGQIYHRGGSLLPLPNEEAQFLQIYFLGNEEAEIKRRCSIIPGTNNKLIQSLQRMFHKYNHYIRTFKTALDKNIHDDMKIIIKADRKPIQGHTGVFNFPTVNEVAIIIANNNFVKRDIVLELRSNELQRIMETHISYDALQYPLMFPRGEDGYTININQVEPGTLNPTNKMVSSMAYYSYRLMIRQNQINHILNYRQL